MLWDTSFCILRKLLWQKSINIHLKEQKYDLENDDKISGFFLQIANYRACILHSGQFWFLFWCDIFGASFGLFLVNFGREFCLRRDKIKLLISLCTVINNNSITMSTTIAIGWPLKTSSLTRLSWDMKYKKGNFFSRKLSAFAGKKVFGLTSAKKYEVDANKKVLSQFTVTKSQSTAGYLAQDIL